MAEQQDRAWSDGEIDDLVGKVLLSDGARKESNLQYVQNNTLASRLKTPMLRLYGEVLRGKSVPDDGQSQVQNQLKLVGLVKVDGDRLVSRNRIYATVFGEEWVKANSPVNYTRILAAVAGMAIAIALGAVGLIIYNSIVNAQVNESVTNFYTYNRRPAEQVADLSRIFGASAPLGPTDFDYKARELFDSLSTQDQLALFNDDYGGPPAQPDDLVAVVNGLCVTMADVDGSARSTAVLEAMKEALARKKGPEGSGSAELVNKLETWLNARALARSNLLKASATSYSAIIGSNDENPALRYERAKVLIQLKEYTLAASDLEQAIAIARRMPRAPATVAPATSTTSANVRASSAPDGTGSPELTQTSGQDLSALLTTATIMASSATATPAALPTPTSTPSAVRSSDFADEKVIRAVAQLVESDSGFLAFYLTSVQGTTRGSSILGEITPTSTGVACFRILHAAPEAGPVDVYANRTRVAANLAYTQTSARRYCIAATDPDPRLPARRQPQHHAAAGQRHCRAGIRRQLPDRHHRLQPEPASGRARGSGQTAGRAIRAARDQRRPECAGARPHPHRCDGAAQQRDFPIVADRELPGRDV